MNLDARIGAFAPRKSKSVSYREAGAGQALVLLHGIGSSSAGWLNQLETLKGYRLIAWDAPGYGGSDLPDNDDYAGALHGLIERLLIKDVVLVANSLGCLIAGTYAAAHPERVRSMVLLGPAGGWADLPDREERLRARLRQLDELGPEGLARERAPTVVAASSPPEALALVQWTHRRLHADGYRQAARFLASGSLLRQARSFQEPVLVACGTEDTLTPEAACKAIAAAFPRGRYLSLPGIGHVPHIETPGRINALIREFVASTS